MPYIQIRISEKEKNQAKKVFDRLGLDMSSAIKIFLKQAVRRKGMPFMLMADNGFSLEEESAIIQTSSEARRGVNTTKAMEKKEALDFLRSL